MARKIEDMPINELEALITRLESQKERLSQCVAEMKSERGRVADELKSGGQIKSAPAFEEFHAQTAP